MNTGYRRAAASSPIDGAGSGTVDNPAVFFCRNDLSHLPQLGRRLAPH